MQSLGSLRRALFFDARIHARIHASTCESDGDGLNCDDTPPVSILMLHKLASQPLPAVVAGGENVDAVRVLLLAGLVKAAIPRPRRTEDGYEKPNATVTEITFMGQSMLKRFPSR